MVPGTPNFILLLVILIYTIFWLGWSDPAPPSAHFMFTPPKLTSIPSFIIIGPKLQKFAIGGVFGVVGRVVGVV